jgi:glycosyltransferase involved in cell wall biosynthesis
MADVLLNVLDALVAVLATDAVAIVDGDGPLGDMADHLEASSSVRIDRVDDPLSLTRDVRLVVAGLEDADRWRDVAHAVTLFVGEGVIALDGRAQADLGSLLDEYSNELVVALQERIAIQADEIAELRGRLAQRPAAALPAAPPETPVPAADVVEVEDQRTPDQRLQARAEDRFAAFYDPEQMLSALGWPDARPADLAGPLPLDRRPPGDPDALRVVIACGSPAGLLRTSWSILQRATQPTAIDIRLPPAADNRIRRTAQAVATVGPHIRVMTYSPATPGALRLGTGDVVEPGWPTEPEQPRAVGFVLAGAPAGGSGGSHSVIQEAMGLAQLGIEANVFVPVAAIDRVRDVYPDAGDVLVAYADDAVLHGATAGVDALVATEYSTVASVIGASRATGALPAYYVQDYEPLFAIDESARADEAVLSYRANPDLRLFAKTHWLANVVTALHAVPVELVTPSIDTGLFHRRDREPAGESPVVRVCAMVRPRTPRRRPLSTVRLMEALRDELGGGIEVVTFGCEEAELLPLTRSGTVPWEHLGVTSRRETAGLLRRSDVFVDLSVYQAFGRTGCEAMACGAVPVLPLHGGAAQYATHDVDALLIDGGDPMQALAAVAGLVRDRAKLGVLAEDGAESTSAFTVRAAAHSWAVGLGAAIAQRRASDRG